MSLPLLPSMSEDKKDFPSSGDNINIEGSSGIAYNEGTVNVDRIIINPPPAEKPESPQHVSPQAVTEFLQAIEKRFQYLKLFHVPQEKVLLQNQYIPIEVTLERRYKHDIETIRGYGESEAELQKVYALKKIAEETRKEQVKWEEARKKHQKLIVLADPGMGKSTLLRMEALKIAGKQLDPPKSPLEKGTLNQNLAIDEIVFPLFLRLSDLAATEKEIIEIVPELIKREYASAAAIEPLLRQKLEAGKCVLLLDALDEVPKKDRLELGKKLNRFASNNNKCPIICTSRIVGYGGRFLDGAKEVEIVPFNKQQREAYINSWFTNAAEYLEDETVSAQGLIRELQQKPQISGLAQNPLLLSLLCSLYQVKELELPARRTQIYHQAVKYMLRDWSKENERKLQQEGWVLAKTELLEFLAYQLSCKNKEVFLLADVWEYLNKYLSQENKADFQQVADLLDELTEADGIIQKLSRDGDYYLFLHRTFQEYLTAAYLQKKIANNKHQGIQLVIDHIWEYDWHETIVLVAGLMDKPMLLIKAILAEKDDIFRTLLLLAGLCLAECDLQAEPFAAKVIKKIVKLWLSYPGASFISSVLVALGKNNYDQAIKILIMALEYSYDLFYDELRKSAVEALGEIGNDQAIKPLITTFNNPGVFVKMSAVEALGKIGNEQAIKLLITALKDPEDTLFNGISHVAGALGKIGNEQAIKPLITALEDSNDDVDRSSAARALGEIGNDQAVEPLITALEDSNDDVRKYAAYALGNIGNDQAIEPLLITALEDSNDDVRKYAAYALGNIGNDQAIKSLITALEDPNNDVRKYAAEALGNIGNDQAVKPLITALKDSNDDVRKYAAEALGNIGNDQAIKPLITALKDFNSLVVHYAAEALGNIGSDQAVEPLITALKYSNCFMRCSAAEALGNIGNDQAVEPLITALKDSYFIMRSYAAKALGKIGNDQAVEPLITALKDTDGFVKSNVAEALGKIGNDKAIQPLITALKDTDGFVKSNAAEALGKIDSSELLKQLIYNWHFNIYDEDLFPIARKLAVRYSREPLKFIPVYPHLVSFSYFPLLVMSRDLLRSIYFSLRLK